MEFLVVIFMLLCLFTIVFFFEGHLFLAILFAASAYFIYPESHLNELSEINEEDKQMIAENLNITNHGNLEVVIKEEETRKIECLIKNGKYYCEQEIEK